MSPSVATSCSAGRVSQPVGAPDRVGRRRADRGRQEDFQMFQNIIRDEQRDVLTSIANRFYEMEREAEYGGERLRTINGDVQEAHGFESVGQGQSRVVLELSDEFVDGQGRFVVKFPLAPFDDNYWQDGRSQNRAELERYPDFPHELRPHVAPIADAHPDAQWVVMPYVRRANQQAYAEDLKYYFEEHGWTLDVGLLENIGWHTTEDVTRLVAIDYGR